MTPSIVASLVLSLLVLCWIAYQVGRSRKPPMLTLNVGEHRDPNLEELRLAELARIVADKSRGFRDAHAEAQELAHLESGLREEREVLLEENSRLRSEVNGLRIQLSRWTEMEVSDVPVR